MSDPADLFQRAYHLHVVENNDDGAIALCREVLASSPEHHEARMLLANMLDDRGAEGDVGESYRLYIETIRGVSSYSKAWWFEEDPLSHLAIWERRHGLATVADILLTIRAILGGSEASLEELLRSPALADSRAQAVVRLAIEKFRRQQSMEP